MTYEEAEALAIAAAKQAIIDNYPAARSQLSNALFGKKLHNKARRLALTMGGFELPHGWTIARVTPDNWVLE